MPNAPTTEFFNKSENKVFRPGQSFLLSLLKISWGFFPTRWKRQGAWYSWSVKSSFLPSWLLILNNSTQLCVDKYTGKIFLASGMSIFSWESYLSRENTCICYSFILETIIFFSSLCLLNQILQSSKQWATSVLTEEVSPLIILPALAFIPYGWNLQSWE